MIVARLRPFFVALASGATTLSRADLFASLSSAERDALLSARLVKPAAPLRTWPCDDPRRRCGRDVLDAARGARSPFVAVCEGSCESEDRCLDVDLTADDLATLTLDRAALARALRTLYRVSALSPDAIDARPDAPLHLGEERTDARTRDVFLFLSPTRATLAAHLDARERVARDTLVLVPTARAVDADRAARHAPGAHVEIALLEDSLAVRDGKLTRVGKPRLVVARDAEADVAGDAPAEGGIAAKLGAKQFSEIAIKVIDGHTVRITAHGKRVHATFIDLGFATKTRNPRAEWKMFLDLCAGHGTFRWKKYGEFKAVKVAVSRLQKRLRESFGLAENPFHDWHNVSGWRAKFFASSEIEEDR